MTARAAEFASIEIRKMSRFERVLFWRVRVISHKNNGPRFFLKLSFKLFRMVFVQLEKILRISPAIIQIIIIHVFCSVVN